MMGLWKRRPYLYAVPGSRRVLICVATAACLAGCHNNYQMPTPKLPADAPNARLRVALRTTPEVVRQMDPTVFTVRLTDAQGHPIDGAGVAVSLVMPAMDMGRNAVAMRPHGSGLYIGTGRFSMDGDWDVIVTATHGAEKAVHTYPFPVR